ncbi:potassium-transporting ATPase subunit KdpC [Pinirhizobacter soli]|uniref:potassium-transporting ATPase subunit KdpC n=1 Tax=Pinirhizobacter soli TaxID=2786953 RepID=UPI00202A6549|nr:potassium-transporting ATPase subunit KdpC [Pinirhizobacter soli]
MSRLIRNALVMLLLMTVITGIAYPLVVTGLAQVLFPSQADGSLIVKNGRPIGSALIGQSFTSPKYFWGRLSATAPAPYTATASSPSNLGPTNPALAKAASDRIAALRAADPGNTAQVPVDLVTASGSGLDAEISPAAAEYQAGRVARARGLPRDRVDELIAGATRGRQWGLFGEPGVNVLALNMALDSAVK